MVNWASGSYGEAGLDRMPAVESSKHCSKSHHRVRERSLLCLCLSFSNSNSFPIKTGAQTQTEEDKVGQHVCDKHETQRCVCEYVCIL